VAALLADLDLDLDLAGVRRLTDAVLRPPAETP